MPYVRRRWTDGLPFDFLVMGSAADGDGAATTSFQPLVFGGDGVAPSVFIGEPGSAGWAGADSGGFVGGGSLGRAVGWVDCKNFSNMSSIRCIRDRISDTSEIQGSGGSVDLEGGWVPARCGARRRDNSLL